MLSERRLVLVDADVLAAPLTRTLLLMSDENIDKSLDATAAQAVAGTLDHPDDTPGPHK